MAASKKHEELVEQIRQNPDAAIAKQLLVPENATCMLLSKQMLGVFDRQDQMELSAKIKNTLNYIAEHDYLAFLVLTNQFDVIREIFWKKELFEKQLALIEALEQKEEEKKENQQYLLYQQEQLSLSNRLQKEQANRDEQRQREAKGVVDLALYRYVLELEKQIHNDFHVKQITILEEAYKGRMTRINRAIEAVADNESVSDADKEALIKLQKDYHEEHAVVQRMHTKKPDGTLDSQALRRKSEAALRVDEKFKRQFSAILSKYPDNPQLAEILREEKDAVRSYEAELTRNLQERDRRLTEIAPHLNEVRRSAKADIEQSMQTSIRCLEKCKSGSYNDRALKESIRKLKGYEQALIHTNDDVRIKDLTARFSLELDNVKQLVKPAMLSDEEYQELHNEARVLKEYTTLMQKELTALNLAQEEHANDSSLNETVQLPVSSSITYTYRGQLFNLRTQQASQSVQEIQNTENTVANDASEHIVEIHDAQQEQIAECFSDIIEKVQEIRSDGDLPQELEEELGQLETLSESISSHSANGEVDLTQLEEVQKIIERIKQECSELKHCSTQLSSIQEGLDSPPRIAL